MASFFSSDAEGVADESNEMNVEDRLNSELGGGGGAGGGAGNGGGSDFDGQDNESVDANGDPRPSLCRDFINGVCKRGQTCPYRHDPNRIIPGQDLTIEPCQKFLRGVCERHPGSCRYRHPPPCRDFLRRECARATGCPFLHLRLNNACRDFLHGHCERGVECFRLHAAPCRDFLMGKCERGQTCNYWHGEVCRNALRGRCTRGLSCNYYHVPALSGLVPEPTSGKRRRVQDDVTNESQLLREENLTLRAENLELRRELALYRAASSGANFSQGVMHAPPQQQQGGRGGPRRRGGGGNARFGGSVYDQYRGNGFQE
eukprot:TRINITY_DN107_c2_g3_i1.p2 TRINITY_DN107_c2_g3~~TRINITY_DN107_c2_g3_i1.p2  ORF type:complete len:316 (-),score=77.98 TRINITY_DN107_c2_g3_i1:618-1565(-)